MNNALLEVRDLCVALPSGADRPFAVKNVSFSLAPGEILCIVGESGSGKSVSANAIMGLLPDAMKPKAGSILFKGNELLHQTEEQRLSWRGKDIGMIFQEPMSALNPIMRVGEQIAEVMAEHGTHSDKARQARVLELLAFVGLPDPERLRHSYPFRLSGGQRQRVMIAMALALEPAIVIADEPTTALDVTTQAQILALIKRIQHAMGMGVIFITHDFGVVAEIADRSSHGERNTGRAGAGAAGAEPATASVHPALDRRSSAFARRRTKVWFRCSIASGKKPAKDLYPCQRIVRQEAHTTSSQQCQL